MNRRALSFGFTVCCALFALTCGCRRIAPEQTVPAPSGSSSSSAGGSRPQALEDIPQAAPLQRGLDCTKGTACQLAEQQSVRFFVMGDWGGSTSGAATTTSEGQVQCANFIKEMGPGARPHFFISTGDNFYPTGVKHADDTRFKHTFDDVFTYGKNQRIPWYVTMGNHDWMGNASAQVAYTHKNDRWVSPDHTFTVQYDASPSGPTIDKVYLDTVVLCGHTKDESVDIEGIDAQSPNAKDGGPDDPSAASRMWKWVESELAKSKADYLFVVGHYPVFSATSHNISNCLVPRLQDLMEKYNVNAYITGHSHNLQHVKTISRKNGQVIHHVIAGAGQFINGAIQNTFRKLRSSPYQVSSEFFFAGSPTRKESSKGGLVYAQLSKTTGSFEFYQCNGDLKYSFDVVPRQKTTAAAAVPVVQAPVVPAVLQAAGVPAVFQGPAQAVLQAGVPAVFQAPAQAALQAAGVQPVLQGPAQAVLPAQAQAALQAAGIPPALQAAIVPAVLTAAGVPPILQAPAQAALQAAAAQVIPQIPKIPVIPPAILPVQQAAASVLQAVPKLPTAINPFAIG